MFDTITKWYNEVRTIMMRKNQIRTMFNTLISYLHGFIASGKKWALKCAYGHFPEKLHCNTPDEYLYRINVKCGWADNLIRISGNVRDNLITYYGNKDKTSLYQCLDEAKSILKSMHDLLVSSVDVIPYNDMDNFNLYIYKVETELDTII